MKEILCFGDSNTYGLIPGTTRRYDRETDGQEFYQRSFTIKDIEL